MPAVEPSLADAKPAEATEAVEVPWTCGRPMRKATNTYNDSDSIVTSFYDKEREVFSVSDKKKLVVMEHSMAP